MEEDRKLLMAIRKSFGGYGGEKMRNALKWSALFVLVAAMAGDGCGKEVVKRHRPEADVVPWPAAALADLDVPADYERLHAQLDRR